MARIDDSHQPFKRKRSIGPGPKKHPKVTQVNDWACSKRPATAKHYVQVCKWIGGGKPRKARTYKLAKKTKKAYNKVYRKWAAKHRVTLQRQGRIKSYRCRRNQRTTCR